MNKLIQKIPQQWRTKFRKHFRISKERRKSNAWLRTHCANIEGSVLSIGSEYDKDGEGGFYQDYFPAAQSYTTSEVTNAFNTDLVLDVRKMPEIANKSYDAIFCSGVLEHVDELQNALDEITRILKPGGILLLGLPFKQAIHMEPNDYWRFTEYGIRHMLKHDYIILELSDIHPDRHTNFPASYWTKAQKNG